MTTNTELNARLRSFETDHKPEGWPAMQMRDVSALLDAIDALEAEVERLTTLARGQHIELYNARLQLAAAQGQEPIDAVPLDDMVEGSHPSYGRGLFATDNCVKQFYAAPIPQQPAEQAPIEADMFWNHDDAEKLYFSIDEFLNDEICDGTPLEVGDTRTIQCALRLPNIEIRITAVHDEECEADYEVVAAAPQPKEKQ